MNLCVLLTIGLAVFAFERTDAAHHNFEFVVEDWVVDFLRPTVALKQKASSRQTPYAIPDENRKGAILVNGQYPGPLIEVNVNDTVSINVVNNLLSEATTIHWHGIHPYETPWTDGTLGVSQAGIRPGENFTYTFRAWPAGTHYWHSHMDGMQSAKGMRGPFVVKDALEERFMPVYDEEKVIVLADEWRDPEVCLKLEGAMAGNDVCSDIDYASFNGQVAWGNLQKPNIKKYPYPLLEVEEGKCYRLRMIMQASNAENYIVTFAGHDTTLVALDGVPVRPLLISEINMHIGERADVILCANQKPGYYPIEMNYDYACALTPGHFIPPGFHAVSSCKFYSFIHYAGFKGLLGPPSHPKGEGGGANPKPLEGVPFDLTNPGDWTKTQPIDVRPEPEEPDARFTIALGLKGPTYKNPTDEPLRHGRWYMDIDGRRETWKKPVTPALHTKNTCGNSGSPVLDIPENASTVEIVLNNLSPTAHNIHLHGLLFQVINIANYSWCNVNKTACFLMPEQLNPCPKEDRRISDIDHKSGVEDFYWGCVYNASKYKSKQNLKTPLRKDSFQLWQRSWAVLRIHAWAPGVWQFHCHMEQHIPLGMIMALNVLPSQQPPIPNNVPTEGPCPVWSAKPEAAHSGLENHQLLKENETLQQRVSELEKELQGKCGAQ
jgi:FtsP/CotA-like multicopper oxidase with cupredoxin domain